jgi:hypothetical protein
MADRQAIQTDTLTEELRGVSWIRFNAINKTMQKDSYKNWQKLFRGRNQSLALLPLPVSRN